MNDPPCEIAIADKSSAPDFQYRCGNILAFLSMLARCQTGIIRTGFSAADFRLNRVTRLANTGGY